MIIYKEKTCERCNTAFAPTGPCSKFCQGCQHSASLENMRNYREKHKVPGPGKGGNQWAENNHRWKGAWYSGLTRRRVFERAEFKCERCGKDLRFWIEDKSKNGQWCIHHKDEDRSNGNYSNLELVCKSCHQAHHEMRDTLGRYVHHKAVSAGS